MIERVIMVMDRVVKQNKAEHAITAQCRYHASSLIHHNAVSYNTGYALNVVYGIAGSLLSRYNHTA